MTPELKALRDGAAEDRRAYAAEQRRRYAARDERRRLLVPANPGAHAISPAEGFRIVPPGLVAGVDEVVADAHLALATYDHDRPPAGKNRKRFLVNVLYGDRLTSDSALVRFALAPEVVAPISVYLGIVPVITSVGVFHSDAFDAVPTSSQLYHCDADDTTQIKVFVYCNDVTAASGPLTIVSAAATERVQAQVGYRYGARLSDDLVRESAPDVREHAVVGPQGTVAFVDTSRCFHYGSRVSPGAPARLAVIIQYSTPYSFMLPPSFTEALPLRHLARPSMSELQRLVLGA